MVATLHPLLGLNAALSSSLMMGCGPVSGQSSLKHNTYSFRHCRGAQRCLHFSPVNTKSQLRIARLIWTTNLSRLLSVEASARRFTSVPTQAVKSPVGSCPTERCPLPAWVTLFAEDDAPKRADSNEYTHEVAQLFADDETGKFVFRHVRPGRYVVAFQPGDPPDMDVPYWPRFYPSAKDRKNAEVIEIAEGQKITDLEFKIGDEVARSLGPRDLARWNRCGECAPTVAQ